jgi:predicted esterase
MTKVLTVLFAALWSLNSFSQNVFNPSDPTVRYDRTRPLGSAQNPNPAIRGLQKWVSTPTNGVSQGTDAYDASSFKAYFLNVNGTLMPFRIKFPYSYSLPSGVGKKYPIMLFLHGAGEVGCPTNNGLYNNEKQLWLGGRLFMQRVDNNQFDGFLVYPQLVNNTECWGAWGAAATAQLTILISMLDSLAKYARADIDRVMIDGLSGGGYGAWRMADNYPQRVAKIIPSASAGSTTGRFNFVHIPIWFATGGKDPDPSPAQAMNTYNRMKEIGANIRYTQYPDLGHAVWTRHWNEPDFVAEMNDMHKANPLIFFGLSEFCAGQTISTKLGITQGFYAYEWQKDGVIIATRTNGVNTIVNGASVSSFTGNEITVRSFGTYSVRFRRNAASAWSAWSPKPAVIKAKVVQPAPAITINGTKSKVLPALDGATTVPLQMPAGYTNYQWQRVSDNVIVATTQIYNAPIGTYRAKYDETPGCGPSFSPNFTVVNANGTPKPDPVTNLTSLMLTTTSARLNWLQGANETGFEIYRATTAGGPYTFIALTAANATSYQDNTLAVNTTYYYVVRAVNETGAAVRSNESSPNGGNLPPTISAAPNMLAQTDASTTMNFGISDAAGDIVTVTLTQKPSFVTLQKISNTSYNLVVNPTVDNLGWSEVIIRATDNKGMYSHDTVSVLVSDKNTRSVYVNFGAPGTAAPAPWNNWLGVRGAGNAISNLRDENNITTTFSVTTVSAWLGTTTLGHITGNNLGVVPDAVLQSGITDNGAAKQILIGGLDATRRYNLVFVGSQNEGITASTIYASGTQQSTLNARYNTEQTANLSNLAPNASGQIIVNITRASGTPVSYLNGMIIEEFNNGLFLNPDNLYVEPADRTSVSLTWSDKTSNETGFELVRATDSLFTQGVTTISLGANVTSYRNTGLLGNMKYWYRVRARNGAAASGYSNRAVTITPGNLVYVNFNTNVPNAPSPWNNLQASPMTAFTTGKMRNYAGALTNISLVLEQVFNGEFNAGVNTGNNSGICPDNALMANYWLDNGQVARFRIAGLSPSLKYRIGFFGSSSSNGWFKGDYTAKYTINGRSVYLNSWMNSTKIVYIGNVVPDASGNVRVDFSTTAAGDWGFNGGLVIQDYADAQGGTVMSAVLDEIAEEDLKPVLVYPNPFAGQFTIDFNNPSAASMVSAEIYDLSGRLLVRKNYNQLPVGRNILSFSAPGNGRNVYFLALKVDGKIVHTRKLMQEK